MADALVQRLLGATISLSQDRSTGLSNQRTSFDEGGNTVTLPSGLKMLAHIEHAGGLSDGTLTLTIWGMTDSLMKQLATLGMQISMVPKNPIVLTAGIQGQMSTAFNGYIVSAYADYNAQPEVAFYITAHTLAAFAAAPAQPSSFQGTADVATIMAGFATSMLLKFENNGVQKTLNNPVFTGSLRDQARKCVKDAGINWNNGDNGTLAIWPRNSTRKNSLVPVIAAPPVGGMIGYPTYTAYGIMLRNLYDPTIGLGQKVQVRSQVLTTGEWGIYGITHDLACQVDDGPWESTLYAYSPKLPTPPVLAHG